ncbi:MAG: amidase family protein, partial [Pseudomonadota bacterium]|nr:amidase family protein [Pseudomonadota bacterium]
MRERSEQVSRIHSFSNDGMGDHDAVALAELIKTNSISSEEITTAAVQRARSVNQRCNAIVSESFESAMAASRKNTSGIFAGVPTFIKDTDDIIGSPTTVGSNAVPD